MTMQKEDAWPILTARVAEIYSIQGDITQSNNLLKEAIVKRDKLMLENGDEYLEQDKELINEVVFTFYMNNDLEQAESLGEYYLESYNKQISYTVENEVYINKYNGNIEINFGE